MKQKRILSFILSLCVLINIFCVAPICSKAAVMANSFSARTTIPTTSSTWITKYNTSNNCTRYVYGRISEILNTDATTILGARPGADSFPSLLSNAGYSYGTTPKPGSVMCTSGHVAIVESVNASNGTLIVSEGHSYTDMSSHSKVINVMVDGKSVIGYSTLTTGASGHGTWFDTRTITYTSTNAKYYYLVKDSTPTPSKDLLPAVKISVDNGKATISWNSYTKKSFSYYYVRVYKDKKWSNTYKAKDVGKSLSAIFNLGDGHYEAYVDCYDSKDNLIATGCDNETAFDVNLKTTRTSRNNNIAFYSWNPHAGATSYTLRVKKVEGDKLVDDDYSIWNIKETSTHVELPDGTYKIYVDANTPDGACQYSVDTVEISSHDPILKASVNGGDVTFNWTAYSGAHHYVLRVYKNRIWTEYADSQSLTNLTTTRKLPVGDYAAFVEVFDANGKSINYGTAIKFSVGSNTIRISRNNNIAFYKWPEYIGATSYTLRVKRVEGSNWVDNGYSIWNIKETETHVELPDGTYKIYVDANTPDGAYQYSIDTVEISSHDPRLTANVNGNIVYFNWTASSKSGVDHYAVRVYKNRIWTEFVISNENVKGLSCSFNNMESGKYAAFVEAYDASNNSMGYGTVIEFTVNHMHSYTLTKTLSATCDKNGEITYSCISCNQTYTEEISSLGHNMIIDNAVLPTCSSTGLTEGSHCSRCDYKISQSIIPMLEHNLVIDKAVAPTCAKAGKTEGSHCSVCGTVIKAQETVSATGHNFVSDNQYCLNNCGTVNPDYKQSHTHSWDNGTVTKKAGCETSGVKTYYCLGCSETKTETIRPTGHNYSSNTVKPSCTENGYIEYMCSKCGDSYRESYVFATGHNYKAEITIATKSVDGKIETKCSVCGDVKSTETIYKPTTYTLSTSTYTYNGSVKSPSLTIKDSKGKTLVKGTDYTVSTPSGRKNVGTYSYKITFKGKYSGTATKSFKINPVKTSISKLTATSKGFKATWSKKSTQVTGYQIQYSTSSKFSSAKTTTVSSYKTTSKIVSKLTAKKKYYVRVRTYKTVSGTKYYSAWSSAKSITTKK